MKTLRKKIVIVGAGPAGVGAALKLARSGYRDMIVLDRFERIGGIPGKYMNHGKPTIVRWSRARTCHGREYADELSGKLRQAGVETWLKTTVINFSPDKKTVEVLSAAGGRLLIGADAVLLACGAREASATERGYIFGERPARICQTFQLLQLIEKVPVLPEASHVITGSEVISYATAEKLRQTGGRVLMVDPDKAPSCSFFSRFYFFGWRSPQRIAGVPHLSVRGRLGVKGVQPDTAAEFLSADNLFLCGQLIPNTELLATAGVSFSAKSRKIEDHALNNLRRQGIFLAGNIRGSGSGAEKAFFNGSRIGGQIAAYLGL